MNKLKFLSIIIFFSLISHIFLFAQLTDKWKTYDAHTFLYETPLGADPTTRNISVLDSNHYVALQYYSQLSGENYAGTIFDKLYYYRGIVKTGDGGITWEQVYLEKMKYSTVSSNRENRNRSIAYPSSSTIIVVGDSTEIIPNQIEKFTTFGKILITKDGGKNWEKIILDSNTQGKDVIMLDENRGVLAMQIMGNDNNNIPVLFKLLYTEDCWKTYKEIYQSSIGRFFDASPGDNLLSFPNPNKIAIIPHRDTLMLSEDLGKSWRSFVMPGYQFSNINFLDDKIGYMQVRDTSLHFKPSRYEKLYKTTDGGYTWTMIFDETEVGHLRSYTVFDEDNYMLVGGFEQSSSYKRTTDGGKSWIFGYIAPYPFQIRYFNPSYIIQFGYDYIQKYMGEKQLIPTYTAHWEKKDTNNRLEVSNKVIWNKVEGATKYQVNVWGKYYGTTLGMGIIQGDQYHGRAHNALSVVTRDTSVDVQLWYLCGYTFSVVAMNDEPAGIMNSNTFNGPPGGETPIGKLARPSIISPPVGHSFVLDNADSLVLRWSRVEGATTYDVYCEIEQGLIYSPTPNYRVALILIDYPDTTYTLDALEPDQSYLLYIASASYNDHSKFVSDRFKIPKVTSVKDIVSKENNLLYPNPVRDKAGLRLYLNKSVQAEIKIVDITGNMRRLWQGMLNEGKNEIELNVADVPRGFYNLILDYGRGNYIFKFMKE